ILVARLREYLQSSYGANWFKNRDCGAYLRELWRAGQPEYGEDLAIRIGCYGPDSRALIRSLNSRQPWLAAMYCARPGPSLPVGSRRPANETRICQKGGTDMKQGYSWSG